MSPVAVERHELGPRCYILGWRCHHYHWGAMLVAVGAWLIYGDRADLRIKPGRFIRARDRLVWT